MTHSPDLRPKSGRWLMLVVGCIIMLAAGLVFSFSIFVEPIEQEMGFSRSQTSLIFPISLSVSILGQIVAGMFAKRQKIRINFIITAMLCGIGFALAGTIQTIGLLLFSYGVLVGLAIGMMYNGVLASVVLYFEQQADLIAGLLLMSFALGSMALGTLSARLIEQVGWRTTFFIFAMLFTALSLLGALVITQPQIDRGGIVKAAFGKQQVSAGTMVRQKAYLLTFIWITVLVSTYLVISGHAALCLSDIGASPYLAAFSIGLMAVANVVARIIVSGMVVHQGTVRVQYLLTFIGLFSSLACLAGYTAKNPLPMLLGYGFLGFLNGGCTIVINSYVMNEFGSRNFGLNMAITNIHLAAASFLGPAAAGVLKENFGNYNSTFLLMSGFGILSFLLLAANRKTI